MFGLVITGVIDVPAGTYVWEARVDDGIRLWVDDEIIFDDWPPKHECELTRKVEIGPGEHRVRVEYWQGIGMSTLIATLRPDQPRESTKVRATSGPNS
jgi:hypothetical protein